MRPNDTLIDPVNLRRIPIEHELSVGMFEWGHTDTDSRILSTVGLASCLGVATYDNFDRIAHLAHFVAVKSDDLGVEAFLDSVIETSRDESKITAWMRGGNARPCGDLCDYGCRKASDIDQCRGVIESRELIVSSLRERGISQDSMDIQWNDTPRCDVKPRIRSGVSMRINRTGRVESSKTYWQGVNRLTTEAIINKL